MTANITDSNSGVKSVRLEYKTNKSVVEVELSMLLNQTSGLYESTIPGQEANTLVKCQITAFDNAGNSFTDDNTGQYYAYTVIPEFPSTVVVTVLLMFLSIALVSLKRRNRGLGVAICLWRARAQTGNPKYYLFRPVHHGCEWGLDIPVKKTDLKPGVVRRR